MYFKIDYDKVSDTGLFLKNKSEELESLYNDVLDICEKIEENYKSEDSAVYLYQFINYIVKFNYENEYLKKGAYVLAKVSSLYSNQEIKWAKSVLNSDLNKGGRE